VDFGGERRYSVIFSMTGFGKGRVEHNGWEFTAEVKSLNNRYLDISLRLPRNLSYMEEQLRKLIQSNISRGRIELFLNFNNATDTTIEVELNQSLVQAYFDCLNTLAAKLNISNNITVTDFLNFPDAMIVRRKDEDSELLKMIANEAVLQAIETLKLMKIKEGSQLKQDILQRVAIVENFLENIKRRSPILTEEYRLKLKERLKELLRSTDLDDSRFNEEVAYFADKANITEEIVRLNSHLHQFRRTMDSGGTIGRKLDFLLQEINREINTIGSKASDLEITNMVIEFKSEIEKIREQIQNIE